MDSLISSLNLVSDLQHCMDIPTNLHQKLVNMVLLVQANIIMDMFQLLFSLVLFFQQLYGCFQGKGHTCKCMCIDETICQEKTNNKNAVTESVRQNIHLIESDLMVADSNLVDELQTNAFLSEEDANKMKSRNRSDQAHLFAENLVVLDYRNFHRVLDMLKKCSFEHIACSLKTSYENVRMNKIFDITCHPICPICRLRYEVDIKGLRCELIKEELLPYSLYIDISGCLDGKGHQYCLWKRLLKHLKSFESESVENKFIKIFDTPRHQGLYKCFKQKFPTHFECSCVS